MKRIVAFLLIVLLALSVPALAESGDGFIGEMVVINCQEYVSLREQPSTKSARLAQVGLGETVTNCHWYNNDFIYCEYKGQPGYILAEYLEPLGGYSDATLDVTLNGLRVLAERARINDGEYLLVTCEDQWGSTLWYWESMTDYMTELTLTDAFLGGTAQDPLVLVYNSETGLTALDFASGVVRWVVTPGDANLGASVSCAVGPDGTAYIGGYYGPNPVAISAAGKVLWHADPKSDDVFWLYELNLLDENVLAAHYDYAFDGGVSGWVYYSLADGSMLGWERDE